MMLRKCFTGMCCFVVIFLAAFSAHAQLVDNGNGTVSDTSTGLMWQQSTAPGTYTWAQALSYCENLVYPSNNGYSDWRLPTQNELLSIAYRGWESSINNDYSIFFPDSVSSFYWSSTTYAYDTGRAWGIYFGFGLYYSNKSYAVYVRAVRGGQSGSFCNLVISKSGSGTVTSSPAGINCGSTCSAGFSTGTEVTLNAAPDNGCTFTGWAGACTGTNPSCTVTMDSNKAITANFSAAPGITVSPPSSPTTTEAGGTATFTITLNSQPTANVTIGLSSSDTTEGTVSPSSVTFTTSNWNEARTVTVTGQNDDVVDGNIAYTIVTAAATSTDSNYNGRNADDVSLTNTDNDTPGITVSAPSGSSTTEAGGTVTFTIKLNSQPTANVTIGLSSSDTSEGAALPTSVTFTTTTWNNPQPVTVTGQNDDLADGNIAYTIVTAAATSTDSNYSGRVVDDVSLTNTDNDAPGITVSAPSGPSTTEAGGTVSFTIRLNSQPTANVTIGLSSSNTLEGTVSPSSLTFTTTTWSNPQPVTVTGQNDSIADGNIAYTIVTGAATSTDSNYSGRAVDDVSLTNTDNDAPGITVSPPSGSSTTETGGTVTFTIKLNSQPTANVTIGLSSSDTQEGTVSPSSVTFTAANWSETRTVTVTGQNDDVDDGDVVYTIVIAPAVSTDGNYNGRDAADVSLTNTDDDMAAATAPVPDTGQTCCYDDAGNMITCPSPGDDFYGQDAQHHGPVRSYTKLGQNGAELADTATQAEGWFMTRDDVTGLIWEIKSESNKNYTYNWSDAQNVFIAQLNNAKYGGYEDWRLPTVKELSTLVNRGTFNPSIDGHWFPHTVPIASYWTSSVAAYYTGNAWIVNFFAGYVNYSAKSNSYYVRAVRGGQTGPSGDLFTNGDGTVTDPNTGLMWQQATAPGTYNWVRALSYIEGLNAETFAGYSDWRLPNYNELQSLVDYSRRDKAVYPFLDSTTEPSYYWSSTTLVKVPNCGWVLNFYEGHDYYANKADSHYIRAVRGGQSITSANLAIFKSGVGAVTSAPAGIYCGKICSNPFPSGTSVTLTAVPAAGYVFSGWSGATCSGTVSSCTVLMDSDKAVSAIFTTEPDILVSPTSGLATNENGGTATFTIKLKTQPTANVTIGLSSDDVSEGKVSPSSVTFTPVNWMNPQTVMVTGEDDSKVDGNMDYKIVTAAATSADSNYNGRNAPDVSLINRDNDKAGVMVSPPSGQETTEAGGAVTFTIRLNTRPSAEVTIGISSSNTLEGTVSPTSVKFTSSTWNNPQTVTVTGKDDNTPDGNVAYTILTAAATSSDSNYNKRHSDDVYLTNIDNETASQSGIMHHFKFSTIGSQTVGKYFNVSIEAVDNSGARVTSFNDYAFLYYNGPGGLSSRGVDITNGYGSFSAELNQNNEGGVISCQCGKFSGKSNSFSVTGGSETTGTISGEVINAEGTIDVILSNTPYGGGIRHWKPGADGQYQFVDVEPGRYYIRAVDSMEKSSVSQSVNVDAGQPTVVDLVMHGDKRPVIFIPGGMGTDQKNNISVYPTLPKKRPADPGDLKIHNPGYLVPGYTGAVGWEKLYDRLKEEYEVYECPYDWRVTLEDSAGTYWKYLIPIIDQAKQETGWEKVDIVAHSMGGLLVRSYIQRDEYRHDIDKFAMVGTPNKGSLSVYYIWEGGDLMLADERAENTEGVGCYFYSHVAQNLYYEVNGEQMFKFKYEGSNIKPTEMLLGDGDVRAFIQDECPSISQLMATFSNCLNNNGTFKSIQAHRNQWLIDLNSNSNLSRIQNGGEVKTRIFAARKERTLSLLNVKDSDVINLYEDGEEETSPEKGDGDGTVLYTSAGLPNVTIVSGDTYGKHSSLIKSCAEDITGFLNEGRVFAAGRMALMAAEEEPVHTSSLGISVSGPPSVLLASPSGLKCGVDQTTGEVFEEMSGSKTLAQSGNAMVIIPDPENGVFTVKLTGFEPGTAVITISYLTETKSRELQLFLYFPGAPVTFALALNPSGSPEILINGILDAPIGLSWSASSSGEIQVARLTWQAPEDQPISGYRIYSRNRNDSDFTLLTELPAAQTQYDVLEFGDDPSIIYAVSAKDSEGREGFLSDFVENTVHLLANFEALPVAGEKTLAVQFSDTTTGTPTQWHWDFGDGETSAEQNPSHTYEKPGVYTVSLTVTDAQASQDIETKSDLITVAAEKGDLNGDGAIDLADAIDALKAMAGMEIEVHAEADTSGDEKIGVEDVVYILQKAAGLR